MLARIGPIALAALFAGVSGCALTIPEIEGAGVGATCDVDADCHAGSCDAGVCAYACSANADCPLPSACFAGSCALPLQISALWGGLVSTGEGWHYAFHEGLERAGDELPYVSWKWEENVVESKAGAVRSVIERHIAEGAQVILGDTYDQQAAMMAASEDHPDVTFLLGGGAVTRRKNLLSFSAAYEQALYAAGRIAATRATSRLGYIASLVSPSEVRAVNAFLLGARSVKPELVVEVAWSGTGIDSSTMPLYPYAGETLFREELLAARLHDSGCEVIAHGSQSQRAVRYIERKVSAGTWSGVFSIANIDDDGCRMLAVDGPTGAMMSSCLGAAYYNFEPAEIALLEAVHRRRLDTSAPLVMPMTTDPESTGAGFALTPGLGIDNDAVQAMLAEVVAMGPDAVFAGPYATTGQRDADDDGTPDAKQHLDDGQVPTAAERRRMCWFVKGVIEKANPLDPSSADVDARVPDGDVEPPPDLLTPTGEAPGTHMKCHENL